jgi:hypothetical protein
MEISAFLRFFYQLGITTVFVGTDVLLLRRKFLSVITPPQFGQGVGAGFSQATKSQSGYLLQP